jgi:predicted P-loop ATPase
VLAVNEEWFTDDLPLNVEGRKVIETLSGRWIVEAAELAGMRKGEVETLKAFLSRRVDRGRLSYARLPTEARRQCVIIGTTNTERYLRDNTGNRRFWPVRIKRFNLATLQRDRDLLWAEAAQAEAAGESIRLDPRLYSAAGKQQEERRVEDPWVPLIAEALGDRKGTVSAEGMWAIVNVAEGMRTQEQNSRLGNAVKELGWERTRSRREVKRVYSYGCGTKEEKKKCIEIRRDLHTRQLSVAGNDDQPCPDVPF